MNLSRSAKAAAFLLLLFWIGMVSPMETPIKVSGRMVGGLWGSVAQAQPRIVVTIAIPDLPTDTRAMSKHKTKVNSYGVAADW